LPGAPFNSTPTVLGKACSFCHENRKASSSNAWAPCLPGHRRPARSRLKWHETIIFGYLQNFLLKLTTNVYRNEMSLLAAALQSFVGGGDYG